MPLLQTLFRPVCLFYCVQRQRKHGYYTNLLNLLFIIITGGIVEKKRTPHIQQTWRHSASQPISNRCINLFLSNDRHRIYIRFHTHKHSNIYSLRMHCLNFPICRTQTHTHRHLKARARLLSKPTTFSTYYVALIINERVYLSLENPRLECV